jgi:hypothetical protein
VDLHLASVAFSALIAAAIRVEVDPCTAAWVERQDLVGALDLELQSARALEVETSTLTVRCNPERDGIEVALGKRVEVLRVRTVADDQRARVVALAAAELVHAGPPITPPRREIVQEVVKSEPRPEPRRPFMTLSLRTELLGTLPPSAGAIAIAFVAEQPDRSLFDALSARASIVAVGIETDHRLLFGGGLRAGVGLPMARTESVRFECEATGGGGLLFDRVHGSELYGEARLALVAHLVLTDSLEMPLSLSASLLAPGGFAVAIGGGLGMPL